MVERLNYRKQLEKCSEGVVNQMAKTEEMG